jgi:hypothetical protein
MLLTQGHAGITVRTFIDETVCFKGENGSIVCVPVKELRGFIAACTLGEDGIPQLIWEKISPTEVEHMYSIDSDTDEYIGLTANIRDHRFV